MGLFSKKKDHEEPSNGSELKAPPAPPKSGDESSSQMPPLPSGPSQDGSNQQAGEHINDIKSQISSNDNSSDLSTNSVENSSSQQQLTDENSLFSVSDEEIKSNSSHTTGNTSESLDEIENELNQFNSSSLSNELDDEDSDETDENLNFIATKNTSHRVSPKENVYVTTEQFKSMLEIIDGVKAKTKESSEKHLRLLDLKAEEDIEYENLKKDFAYIEDKLYQVDSLLFEK